MLKVLLDINYAIDSKFNKRIGLKKRIYSIITEAMMFIPKDNITNLFVQDSTVEKELMILFVAYKKTYNLNTQIMIDLCGNTIRIIDDLCHIMNERMIYSSNLYNGINRRGFINKVIEEAFKDD
jgi:hypothetical protein